MEDVVNWGSSFVIPVDMEVAVVRTAFVLVAVVDNDTFTDVTDKSKGVALGYNYYCFHLFYYKV